MLLFFAPHARCVRTADPPPSSLPVRVYYIFRWVAGCAGTRVSSLFFFVTTRNSPETAKHLRVRVCVCVRAYEMAAYARAVISNGVYIFAGRELNL